MIENLFSFILHYLQNVLDHETWIFNLTEANGVTAQDRDEKTPPQWFKEYSFREEYNVTSLSPAVLSRAAIEQWTTNTTTLRTVIAVEFQLRKYIVKVY